MRRWNHRHHYVLACWATLSCAALVWADNWPSWRGPEANGVSKETKLPAEWGENKNVVWKLPLPGKGGSTPVIWGDRIFLTSGDGAQLVLLCVDTSGKPLWKRKVGSGTKLFKKGETNQASASPCTDGKRVFAFFASGDLACFDFQGNQVWAFNVQDRYKKFSIQHGIHTTPVLHGDKLFLTLLHANAHWVIALDPATGKEVWKVARKTDAMGESKEAYTTPCVWQNGGDPCLVVLGADIATGHRLSDGAEVWRLTGLNPSAKYNFAFRIISSPVASGDLLVVPTCRGTRWWRSSRGRREPSAPAVRSNCGVIAKAPRTCPRR